MLIVAAVFFPILVSPLFVFGQRYKGLSLTGFAYAVAAIELILVGLCVALIPSVSALQPVVQLPWIPDLGVFLTLGWDPFTQLMCVLGAMTIPLIIAAAASHDALTNKGYFYALLFVLQTALLGVFANLDLFGFYVFWELSLIPAYFMVLCWGGDGMAKITLKFFIYTFAGSLLMLLAFVYLFVVTPGPHSFLLVQLVGNQIPLQAQVWICIALLVAFAIKTPLFPFHTWQPDTYQKSVFPVSMVLGALLSKLGLVGIFKILIPVFPSAAALVAPIVAGLGLVGLIYGAAMALVQTNIKRMIAYASISHLGLLMAGAVSLTVQGFQGAMFQIVAHAFITIGMFWIAQILSDKLGITQISDLSYGVNGMSRLFSSAFFVLLLAMVGFPLTIGFVGEFLLVWGLATGPIYPLVFGPLAVSTLVFGAWYMFRMYHNVMYGDLRVHQPLVLNVTERTVLAMLIVIVIGLGVYPKPVMHFSDRYIHQMIEGSTR